MARGNKLKSNRKSRDKQPPSKAGETITRQGLTLRLQPAVLGLGAADQRAPKESIAKELSRVDPSGEHDDERDSEAGDILDDGSAGVETLP